MGTYDEMTAYLDRREAEVMAELEQIKALRAAIGGVPPIRGVAATGLGQGTVTATGTSGPPKPSSVQVKVTSAPPPSMAEAARQVLAKAGRPLHIKDIIRGIQALGVANGRMEVRIRSTLTPALQRRKDLFINPSRGVYGLKEGPTK